MKALPRRGRTSALVAGFAVLVCLSTFACSPGIFWDQVYQPDAPLFKAAVMRIVPIDTTTAKARFAIEAKGFKCNMFFNEPYSDFSSPDGQQVNYPPSDTLSCISAHTVKLIIEKDWVVTFVIVADKVTAVATNVYFTGM